MTEKSKRYIEAEQFQNENMGRAHSSAYCASEIAEHWLKAGELDRAEEFYILAGKYNWAGAARVFKRAGDEVRSDKFWDLLSKKDNISTLEDFIIVGECTFTQLNEGVVYFGEGVSKMKDNLVLLNRKSLFRNYELKKITKKQLIEMGHIIQVDQGRISVRDLHKSFLKHIVKPDLLKQYGIKLRDRYGSSGRDGSFPPSVELELEGVQPNRFVPLMVQLYNVRTGDSGIGYDTDYTFRITTKGKSPEGDHY